MVLMMSLPLPAACPSPGPVGEHHHYSCPTQCLPPELPPFADGKSSSACALPHSPPFSSWQPHVPGLAAYILEQLLTRFISSSITQPAKGFYLCQWLQPCVLNEIPMPAHLPRRYGCPCSVRLALHTTPVLPTREGSGFRVQGQGTLKHLLCCMHRSDLDHVACSACCLWSTCAMATANVGSHPGCNLVCVCVLIDIPWRPWLTNWLMHRWLVCRTTGLSQRSQKCLRHPATHQYAAACSSSLRPHLARVVICSWCHELQQINLQMHRTSCVAQSTLDRSRNR